MHLQNGEQPNAVTKGFSKYFHKNSGDRALPQQSF